MNEKLFENPNDGWSPFPPEEPGQYWFYGYMWMAHKEEYHNEDRMKLERVVVSEISNGIMFVTNGAFIYPHSTRENQIGLWKRIDVPETEWMNEKVDKLADMFYSHL